MCVHVSRSTICLFAALALGAAHSVEPAEGSGTRLGRDYLLYLDISGSIIDGDRGSNESPAAVMRRQLDRLLTQIEDYRVDSRIDTVQVLTFGSLVRPLNGDWQDALATWAETRPSDFTNIEALVEDLEVRINPQVGRNGAIRPRFVIIASDFIHDYEPLNSSGVRIDVCSRNGRAQGQSFADRAQSRIANKVAALNPETVESRGYAFKTAFALMTYPTRSPYGSDEGNACFGRLAQEALS